MDKMKTILITLLLSTMLCGCELEENNDDTYDDYFVTVSWNKKHQIVYAKDTKVMYAISRGYSHPITVLVDENGKPLIYEKGE